jgi:hypothetical protein
MPYTIPLLKYKLRQLKKLEQTIRFKNQPKTESQRLVWDVFFSTKTENSSVKYSLHQLLKMDHQQYHQAIEEYFYRIYLQKYTEGGLTLADIYDPRLLGLLGLPAYAGLQDVKKRFRELAMVYHPDHGGDGEKFITLMDIYEKIIGEGK